MTPQLRTIVGTIAVLALLLSVVITVNTGRAVAPQPGAIERTWQRTDKPVDDLQAIRTWMWGPDAFTPAFSEPYAQSPGGMRTVQYYDKSRMEITNPNAVDDGVWYVSNGLLVVEMVDGYIQHGDLAAQRDHSPDPAGINIAGDPGERPTYADISRLALRNAAAATVGTVVTATYTEDNTIAVDPAYANAGVTAAQYVPETDHTVASPFWSFMNAQGTVWENGQYVTDALFENPYYATGYPITEAYWSIIAVGNTERAVLWQCFERRCLTYTPTNDPAWQVEAGNVGRHYFSWRYDDNPPVFPTPAATQTAPTATTTPTQPAPTATPTEPSQACHPSYPDHCIPPPPPDLNCPDIPAAWKPLRVIHTVPNPDPHDLDGDKDGWACTS